MSNEWVDGTFEAGADGDGASDGADATDRSEPSVAEPVEGVELGETGSGSSFEPEEDTPGRTVD